MNENEPPENKKNFEELKNNEELSKKVVRIAQFESELDLGVNPRKLEQANVGYLTEKDFEYIRRVCVLVEKRLHDPVWLTQTLEDIENKKEKKYRSTRGIKFDDELFKTGRGILENYLKDKEE